MFSFKFTDMWCERLLALIRQAIDGKDVDVERICSNGILAQASSEHRRRGFLDPRTGTTRAQLLEDNVQLRCKQNKIASKPHGT